MMIKFKFISDLPEDDDDENVVGDDPDDDEDEDEDDEDVEGGSDQGESLNQITSRISHSLYQ